jgi:hypothetical protein
MENSTQNDNPADAELWFLFPTVTTVKDNPTRQRQNTSLTANG